MPPFGYDWSEDGIRIVEEEAEIVRFIFGEFLRTKRYTTVMTAVREAGLCSAVKYTKKGLSRGGKPLNPSTVYAIIRSPIYVGEIQGHVQTYEGRHEPIISRETWDAAQALSTARKRPIPHAKQTNHFLASLLCDDLGRHMYLDWHRGKPYYCYASSNATWSQTEFRRAYRSRADHPDKLIIASISAFLSDRGQVRSALKGLGVYGEDLNALAVRGKAAAAHLEAYPLEAMEELLTALLLGIEVGEERLCITFRAVELRRLLLWDGKTAFRGRPADWPCSDARHVLDIDVRAISAERWPVVHIHPRDDTLRTAPNAKLVRLLRSARAAQRLVEDHRDWSLEELARKIDCRPGHFSRLIRLNYLAPDIVTSILDGTQPVDLTSNVLLKANLPTDWVLQRKLLGYPAPERKLNPRNLFGRGMWPSASSHA